MPRHEDLGEAVRVEQRQVRQGLPVRRAVEILASLSDARRFEFLCACGRRLEKDYAERERALHAAAAAAGMPREWALDAGLMARMEEARGYNRQSLAHLLRLVRNANDHGVHTVAGRPLGEYVLGAFPRLAVVAWQARCWGV